MVQEFSIGQEKELSGLVQSVFDEFVGYAYTSQGNSIFYEFIKPECILERFLKGNILLTHQTDNSINGMIEVRDYCHICLFFVRKNFHHQGIGKSLMHAAINKIQGKSNFLEVNASPYSEKIYSKLGFVTTGTLTEKNGIQFIPMKKLLG